MHLNVPGRIRRGYTPGQAGLRWRILPSSSQRFQFRRQIGPSSHLVSRYLARWRQGREAWNARRPGSVIGAKRNALWQKASAGVNNGLSDMQILRYTGPKRSQLLSPGPVQTNSFSSSSSTELFQSISFGDCAGWTKTVHPKQNALEYPEVSKTPWCRYTRLLPVTASLWLKSRLVNLVRLLGPVRSPSARLTQR